jgi:hypothetical protein
MAPTIEVRRILMVMIFSVSPPKSTKPFSGQSTPSVWNYVNGCSLGSNCSLPLVTVGARFTRASCESSSHTWAQQNPHDLKQDSVMCSRYFRQTRVVDYWETTCLENILSRDVYGVSLWSELLLFAPRERMWTHVGATPHFGREVTGYLDENQLPGKTGWSGWLIR